MQPRLQLKVYYEKFESYPKVWKINNIIYLLWDHSKYISFLYYFKLNIDISIIKFNNEIKVSTVVPHMVQRMNGKSCKTFTTHYQSIFLRM